MFYYFIIVSCFHLSLASWLLFSNKVQFSCFDPLRCKTVQQNAQDRNYEKDMTAQTSMIFHTIRQILEYSCSAKATVHSVSYTVDSTLASSLYATQYRN